MDGPQASWGVSGQPWEALLPHHCYQEPGPQSVESRPCPFPALQRGRRQAVLCALGRQPGSAEMGMDPFPRPQRPGVEALDLADWAVSWGAVGPGVGRPTAGGGLWAAGSTLSQTDPCSRQIHAGRCKIN